MGRFDNAVSFDLETTGTDLAGDQPVSYALVFNNPDGLTSEYELVKPTVPISDGAFAVHGISQGDVDARGVDLETALRHLGNSLCRASREGRILVGMNVSFDLTMLDQLLHQHFGKGLMEAGWNGPIFDAIVLDRHVDKYRKGKRTLTALCAEYGVEFENAHDALADSVACLNLCQAICERHPELDAIRNEDLVSLQSKAYLDWAAGYNEYRLRTHQSAITLYDSWPILLRAPSQAVEQQVSLMQTQ